MNARPEVGVVRTEPGECALVSALHSPAGTPVFLVGMPRSGTKLLRALLNRHPQLHIPEHESHFIPYLAAHPAARRDLREPAAFERLWRQVAGTGFQHRLAARGEAVDPARWHAALRDGSYADFVATLFRLLAADAGKPRWGDKTPQYLTRLALLDELFPAARFVHIVRDARDHCLSMRRTWGKHLLRAAQRWADDVARCRRDGAALSPGRYFELRYEDLTRAPASVLAPLCAFLDLDFDPGMTRLERPAEKLGDTRGAARVVADNVEKWRASLTAREVTGIEAVTADVMRACGYAVDHAGPARRLSVTAMRLAYAHDAVAVSLAILRDADGLGGRLASLRSALAFRVRPRQDAAR